MSWITSLNGALTVSVLAILSFIAYALLQFRYFLEDWTPGIPAAITETLFVLALVGGWVWALLAASRGSRGALIAALVLSALPVLISLYDIILYSPIPYGWPLLQIGVWVMLVLSALAVAMVALQLRR